ncbi:Transcriptional activator protein lysR [Corynebacterium kutscheri]|uniref:Probable hydrogen peroxide-inducible genes activator n=1 Tax=Corynebacterium kutscheri TaxID=35755 RepID=A0A0F6QZX5_9CORY|nr:hydrogen peroxide-inducible genes activator [Corynebacterium kutscheri]AKE41387.1 transcriptional regulator [Corynebacterium kutscheri]VEH08664.1 Transcriptional activator protein lysR [Corynebacterium kutscheri]VEH09711.1 Transcriptional activator protein lysR [Corynebacterium kutscheri]VEH79793.1 Transcriptional activator protein lysR [Corynebacterium kutscheri]
MNNKEYRPTLAQLRTFVTIAENRHFGTAAAKLNISQPSLSQALVALETGLDVQLIERSTRRVIITPAGQSLLPYAKATLEAADVFMAHALGAAGTLHGPLTLGIIPTIAPYILPEILAITQKDFPELQLNIVEDQTKHLLTGLRDGVLDCAILATPNNQAGIQEIPMYTEKFVMVVPEGHELAGKEDLTLDNLRNVDLLLLDDGHCLHDQIVSLCHQIDLNPEESTSTSHTRSASLTTIMQLVSAGMGATLVPESAVDIECSRPGVETAYFSDFVNARRDIGLAFRTSFSRTDDYRLLAASLTQAFHEAIEKL